MYLVEQFFQTPWENDRTMGINIHNFGMCHPMRGVMKRFPKLFSFQPWTSRWGRVTLLFLLVAAVFLTSFITQRPQSLWKRLTYTNPPSAPSAPARFTTLPPGATLPSESECASRVRRNSWEPRLDNYTANYRIPSHQQIADLAPWDSYSGQDPKADTLRRQITGNFTGTTDEILQWVACKWGIDEDIVRAEAVAESHWHQSQEGDQTNDRRLCPPGTWNGTSCYQSYGILQIKYIYNKTAWPMSRDDTAFSAEYMYGIIRACYEGWTTYLSESIPVAGYPRYHAGDIWGCIGRWYSGGWYVQDAIGYINSVKAHLANEEWRQAGF
jgi:hypothetical protein